MMEEEKFLRDTPLRDVKVNEIIEMEWEMFQKVNSMGGRASCQDDWNTFYIMRYSQTVIMDDVTISSYKMDLDGASLAGRNLIMEKYAYMMETTDPVYYENELKPSLPVIGETANKLAEEIADRMKTAEERFAEKYPKFSGRGRPIDNDIDGVTSVRTYALGELKTYSERTLKHYLESINTIESQGKSIAYMVHNEVAGFYGYDNVEQAERNIS